MPEAITPEDKKWAAESDARTLSEAHIIINDEKRLNAARKAANRLAKEAKKSFEGMLKVAGKSSTTVEGMKILKKD